MNTVKQDDEFDLIQLVEVLWAGKLVILALVSLSVAIGFSFTVYKKKSIPEPHFVVSAPYSVNLFRHLDSQICREQFNYDAVSIAFVSQEQRKDLDCVRKRMSTDLEILAEPQWSSNRFIEQEWAAAGLDLNVLKPDCPTAFCLSIITRSPLDPNIYNAQLQGYNEILTEGVVKEIKSELSFQFEQNSNAVIASEAYAENILA